MAIQIGGTTVINGSKQLQNISGLDATSKGNMPFMSAPVVSTTTYTATNTNTTVNDRFSLQDTDSASHNNFRTRPKTTSTSNTLVVLDSTLPTFTGTSILRFDFTASVGSLLTSGGYLGAFYRIWAEIDNNNIYPVMQKGSFTTNTSTIETVIEAQQLFDIAALSTADDPPENSYSHLNLINGNRAPLNFTSGGKLLVEFYNYHDNNGVIYQYGQFNFVDFTFSIKVYSDIDQSFFDLDILYAG